MGAATIQQMADRVAGLMEQRLRIKGSGLAEKLRRGGSALPRRIRTDAAFLAEAAGQAQNPKLLMQIDEAKVAEAYDACLRHLNSVNAAARRRAMLMGMASSAAFAIATVAALLVGVLWWRGFLG